MIDHQLGVVEARFADLIWAHAPLSSRELVALAKEVLEWKKSTTYTVLKRLCDKGLFENSGGNVTARISRQEYDALRSERFVRDTFDGSLPAFLAAFTTRNRLTAEEVEELRRMVAQYEEG